MLKTPICKRISKRVEKIDILFFITVLNSLIIKQSRAIKRLSFETPLQIEEILR
jgi:hypothetical protein